MSGVPPRFPNKFVILGVSFILAGVVLLLWTGGFLDKIVNLWPMLPLLAGLVAFYYRVFRHGPDYSIFVGTSLVLGALLLLLTTTVFPTTLAQMWPLFMTIIGVAMLVYGLRKKTFARLTFTIPGGAMVLLSGVFLPFSLKIVSIDFAQFVAIWWPVIFVLVGGTLLVTHLVRKRHRETDQSATR